MKKVIYSLFSAVVLSCAVIITTGYSSPGELKEISAKALDDHECDTSEWHFVINQIDSEANAPDHILVRWEGVPDPIAVPRASFTGKVAHYATTLHLDKAVSSATAQIYTSWDGQFNLSHGPCDPGPLTATYSIEELCWEPGRKNVTFTIFHVTLDVQGPNGSFEIGELNKAQFEIDETVKMELEPGDYTYTAQADEGYELEGEPEGEFSIEKCPVNGGNGDEGFGGENFLQNAIIAGFTSAAVLFAILLLFSLRRKTS